MTKSRLQFAILLAAFAVAAFALLACTNDSRAELQTPQCDRWNISGEWTAQASKPLPSGRASFKVTLSYVMDGDNFDGGYEKGADTLPGKITGKYEGDRLTLRFVEDDVSAELALQSDGRTAKGELSPGGESFDMWLMSRRPECLY